jgi:NADPH-dependent 2,4-dienoyl-CoA reductase/sulfur reductase-like enzyme
MASDLSQTIREELLSHDVRLHAGHAVERIEAAGENMLRVNGSGVELDADMVLFAMGILPNSEIAAKAGLQSGPGRSIAVDRNLRTSDEAIFAAGDCADAVHVVTGQKTWIPLALRANRAGWAVADNVCGIETELPGIVGTAVFKVFREQVARTGLTEKESEKSGFDPVSVTISSRSRAHAHPGSQTIQVQMVGDRKSGRLLGVQMVGREGVAHRINAAAVALHGRMTVAQFAQCDLAYAPPFGPVWDPLLTAANQLLKKMK